MSAQPTAWDRAHAKSCWARRCVATDVAQDMNPRPLDGVYASYLDGGEHPRGGIPRPPPFRFEVIATAPPQRTEPPPEVLKEDFMRRWNEWLKRRTAA